MMIAYVKLTKKLSIVDICVSPCFQVCQGSYIHLAPRAVLFEQDPGTSNKSYLGEFVKRFFGGGLG